MQEIEGVLPIELLSKANERINKDVIEATIFRLVNLLKARARLELEFEKSPQDVDLGKALKASQDRVSRIFNGDWQAIPDNIDEVTYGKVK